MQTKELEALYRTMLRIRRFDEGVIELFKEGLVKGTAHSYVGQEAVAAGACATLTKDDGTVISERCLLATTPFARVVLELVAAIEIAVEDHIGEPAQAAIEREGLSELAEVQRPPNTNGSLARMPFDV